MVEKYNEVSLLNLCPPSLRERIKILEFSRLRGWVIIAMDSASVKSMIYVKNCPSGRIFSEKNVVLFCFLIVENFIQYGQEKNILPWNTGEVSM